MSRECPKASEGGMGRGAGGGSRACFKCGEEGHMSRECTSAGQSTPKTGNRACFKCGEEGHMSRECPKAGESGAGRGTGGGSRACFKCGEEGHMSRECPKAGEGGGGGRGPGVEGAKVFVGGLSFNSTEESVRAFFESTGTIVFLKIPLNPETEKPRGFCHLEFSSTDEAEKAVSELNG